MKRKRTKKVILAVMLLVIVVSIFSLNVFAFYGPDNSASIVESYSSKLTIRTTNRDNLTTHQYISQDLSLMDTSLWGNNNTVAQSTNTTEFRIQRNADGIEIKDISYMSDGNTRKFDQVIWKLTEAVGLDVKESNDETLVLNFDGYNPDYINGYQVYNTTNPHISATVFDTEGNKSVFGIDLYSNSEGAVHYIPYAEAINITNLSNTEPLYRIQIDINKLIRLKLGDGWYLITSLDVMVESKDVVSVNDNLDYNGAMVFRGYNGVAHGNKLIYQYFDNLLINYGEKTGEEYYERGKQEGYTEGYQKGISESQTFSGFTDFLGKTTGGFLNAEIIPGITIGGILVVIIALAVLLAFLKYFR